MGRFISFGGESLAWCGWKNSIDAIDEEYFSAEAEDDRPVSRRKKRKYNAFWKETT